MRDATSAQSMSRRATRIVALTVIMLGRDKRERGGGSDGI